MAIEGSCCSSCQSKDSEIEFLRQLLKQALESKDKMFEEFMAPYKPTNQIFEPKNDSGMTLVVNGKDPEGNEVNQLINIHQELLGH